MSGLYSIYNSYLVEFSSRCYLNFNDSFTYYFSDAITYFNDAIIYLVDLSFIYLDDTYYTAILLDDTVNKF